MADVVSRRVLQPTVFIPAGHSRGCVFSFPERIPIRISASNLTHLKSGLKNASTAPNASFWGPATPLLKGPGIPQDARGDAVTPIASSSRDAGGSNGGEDNNDNENRSWWSPRDGFGLYPWDPSWQAMDFDGVLVLPGFVARVQSVISQEQEALGNSSYQCLLQDMWSMYSAVVLYPHSLIDMQWLQEETITLFTTEGVVKLRNSRIVTPRSSSNERKYAHLRDLNRLRRYREEDYMDPKQGLCLGAIFDIAATNGLDMGRRFCVFGFCRSIEMLSDVVEDTILEQGGEVVMAEKGSTTGLHEKLTMTVAMPALWGVPPAFDVLNKAIRSGGGIVEKTYKKWEFF